jgi:DNA-binding PadR family transcriptional regulator
MPKEEAVTAQAALLRVLIAGEADGPEIVRKIRDWTEGQVDLDEATFMSTVLALEGLGLIERHDGLADQRTGGPHVTFALTPTGHASAVEILAASLTRKA